MTENENTPDVNAPAPTDAPAETPAEAPAAPTTPAPPAEPVAEAPPPEAPEAPAAEEVPAAVEAPAEPKPEAKPKPKPKPAPQRTPPDGHFWWGTGRRKRSVARVRIRPGTGKFIVNNRPFDTFFPGERDRKDLLNVLERTRTEDSVDIVVNVRGGGYTGQAGAILLGLARALNRFDGTLEPILRDNNFLTRDPRKVERKKPGQPGARKRFQFSKR